MKQYEEPAIEVVRLGLTDRLTFDGAGNEDMTFDYTTSEGVEDW